MKFEVTWHHKTSANMVISSEVGVGIHVHVEEYERGPAAGERGPAAGVQSKTDMRIERSN